MFFYTAQQSWRHNLDPRPSPPLYVSPIFAGNSHRSDIRRVPSPLPHPPLCGGLFRYRRQGDPSRHRSQGADVRHAQVSPRGPEAHHRRVRASLPGEFRVAFVLFQGLCGGVRFRGRTGGHFLTGKSLFGSA